MNTRGVEAELLARRSDFGTAIAFSSVSRMRRVIGDTARLCPRLHRCLTTRPPALQLAALTKAECKTVFKDDGLSGAATKHPGLLRCLKKLEHGETLIVWKLDRLGRSLRDLITRVDDLEKHRGVKFRSLTEARDTETPKAARCGRRLASSLN